MTCYRPAARAAGDILSRAGILSRPPPGRFLTRCGDFLVMIHSFKWTLWLIFAILLMYAMAALWVYLGWSQESAFRVVIIGMVGMLMADKYSNPKRREL